jgi:hypothetical protein
MTMRLHPVPVLLGTLLAIWLAFPGAAHAHCDSMDGPVVKAAQAALAQQNVDLALIWVQPAQEAEIREAFRRTLQVRAGVPAARELADLWFFETLVRLHREGEGAPYTGLKPAGWQAPALVVAADSALASGRVAPLAARVAEHVSREVHEKYEQVKTLESRDPADVEAGRRYVAAYVEYTHLLEELHHLLHGGGHGAQHASQQVQHTREQH